MGKKKAYDAEGVELTAEEIREVSPQAPTVVIQNVNPALAKNKEDSDKITRLNAEFRKLLHDDEVITWKPPKFYEQYLGKVYHYTFNNHDVLVRFDGKAQKFPVTVYNHLMAKLARILESNTPNELEVDEL